jgi:hypothetical protein
MEGERRFAGIEEAKSFFLDACFDFKVRIDFRKITHKFSPL